MPCTYLIIATLSLLGSDPVARAVETRIGTTVDAVVSALCADDLGRSDLTAVHAVDLVAGGAGATLDVTAEVLRLAAAALNASKAELPRSLIAAFERHGVPEPTSWIAEYRRIDQEIADIRRAAAAPLTFPLRLAA